MLFTDRYEGQEVHCVMNFIFIGLDPLYSIPPNIVYETSFLLFWDLQVVLLPTIII